MIITNVNNLPQQLVELASANYKYKENEYRATSLIRGLKETLLLRRHDHEIKVDVANMIWMLFGTAVHILLESKNTAKNEIKEKRLKTKIGRHILSGQPDLYCSSTGRLTDYKTTSAWKIMKRNFADWYMQGLIYTFLLESEGYPVKENTFIAFIKDHSASEASRSREYPELPVYTYNFNVTDKDRSFIKEWLLERFALISRYEKLDDDNIPVCTPQERWVSDWAVIKKGAKRATRSLKTEEEAFSWLYENVKEDDILNYNVISRGDRKCLDYCYVNTFCSYYKEAYYDKYQESIRKVG